MSAESKVTAEHLKRAAYLYIRQSTLRQVMENTESTERQYALRRRAIVLGWAEERIVVIDEDQGQSGASINGREGFQRLVAEVGMGQAGIVMGLEVSRLARNCADWHRLLEICSLTHCLILDEDGLYDPGYYNDRLLLGLKGTMSEAELHLLRARLIGGVVSKAQRGELRMLLPVGLVYDEQDHVIFDPDQQVQQSLRVFFATFARAGSARQTVREFTRQNLTFPNRGPAGRGEICWQPLTSRMALDTLHHPRYAGAFCYGRSRSWKDAEGKHHTQRLPREQWRFLKVEAHPGYLSWEQFLANQKRLLENFQETAGAARKAGPAREGPALLQGLALCGRCGRALTVSYHHRGGKLSPNYECCTEAANKGEAPCQRIPGGGVDEAIGQLLVQSVTPLALEVALNVQSEIQSRLAEAERLRQQQVQRAQYEAERAQVRYMRVDPNNRLVADTLETQWNEKLRLLAQAKEECQSQQRLDALQLTQEQRAKILALASDFPRVWQDPKTPERERKRMARLLLEDVTLRRDEDITVQVRFKGGATHQLHLPLPQSVTVTRKSKLELIARIDHLLDEHSEAEVARLLNERGCRSSTGQPFSLTLIQGLRRTYRMKSRFARLQERGLLTARQIEDMFGPGTNRAKYWRKVGVLKVVKLNQHYKDLYVRPTEAELETMRHRHRNPQPQTLND
jgi:DNA invertase Pin-like site-specific DNA recombinase